MKVAVALIVCLLQNAGVFGANPNYSYHVKIDDPTHINFQEKAETRKGEDAQGFYSVLEPNGALRTVSYIADERGFNPIVSYSYGHPQSSVAVHSATGPASIVKQSGVYAPAYVSDNRVQIVDKSNIYAAPPPALNIQAFNLPGPSAPVVVPAPLRVAAPVKLASAAIATNYAPAYVPPPAAYLPPPQTFAVQQQQVYAPPPQVVVQQQQVYAPPTPQVVVQQQQVYAPPPPQVLAVQAPPPVIAVQPAKVLTLPAIAPAVKVVKSTPTVAVVKDSYSEPPRNTFINPNAPSYPDAVKVVKAPVAEYGPPAYLPPAPLGEVPVKVVEQAPVKVVQPVVQQVIPAPPPPVLQVQKIAVAQPALVQKVAVAPAVTGLYAGAIGFHTHTVNPDSYIHSYGTQGFQVTSLRKFNKALLPVQQQYIAAPQPVYAPQPQVVVQKTVQPVAAYGPPPVKVFAPRPAYAAPAIVQQQIVHQPIAIPQRVAAIQAVAPPPQYLAAAPLPVAAPVVAAAAAPPAILTGKKQNPLTFAYSYDQGGAKVSHSYSGSGW